MSEITVKKIDENPFRTSFLFKAEDENGETMSEGIARYINTRFGRDYVKTMTMGAIATPVHFRRHGNVRKIFSSAFDMAMQDDVCVSMLHPFSFSYYNLFGYEKVSDHLIVKCPIRVIDFVPRCCDFVKYEGSKDQIADLLSVYSEFSKGRFLMRERFDDTYFKNKEIYIYYENGKPTGYISYKTEKELLVNHMGNGLMTVYETVYTTSQALNAIFGLIRMYEGELEDVEFLNIAMCPEVELSLRHYTHTSYKLLPDIMARIVNTEKMLLAYEFPEREGRFKIEVIDNLPAAKGKFSVEYGGGEATVKRLSVNAQTDLTLELSNLTRIVYGYDAVTAQQARFIKGLEINGNATDFFAAFPKRSLGAYEHF